MRFIPKKVSLKDSTLSNIKKRAVAEGTSASEIARRALEAAFDNPEGSKVGPGPGIDLEMLKKAIWEEREEEKEKQKLLAEMGLLPDPPNGSGISPQIIELQVETLTKTYELLRKISLHLSQEKTKEHEDRVKYAEAMAMETVKKLNLGGAK
jgi:hypothetical protein